MRWRTWVRRFVTYLLAWLAISFAVELAQILSGGWWQDEVAGLVIMLGLIAFGLVRWYRGRERHSNPDPARAQALMRNHQDRWFQG